MYWRCRVRKGEMSTGTCGMEEGDEGLGWSGVLIRLGDVIPRPVPLLACFLAV